MHKFVYKPDALHLKHVNLDGQISSWISSHLARGVWVQNSLAWEGLTLRALNKYMHFPVLFEDCVAVHITLVCCGLLSISMLWARPSMEYSSAESWVFHSMQSLIVW